MGSGGEERRGEGVRGCTFKRKQAPRSKPPSRSRRRLLRRARLGASESLPPFRMCLWVGDCEVAEKIVPLGAASCAPASRAHRAAGGRAALGGSGSGSEGAAARGALRELAGDDGAAQPAPGLPQGADEAVDRALRVQGHDVPYVEEAGHFIRHTASCSKGGVLPLLRALAASRGSRAARAERSARPRRPERLRSAPPDRARSAQRPPGQPASGQAGHGRDAPRRAQPGGPESRGGRLPGRFPVPF